MSNKLSKATRLAICLGVVLSLSAGKCANNNNNDEITEVDQCSTHDNQEKLCRLATERVSKKPCVFESGTTAGQGQCLRLKDIVNAVRDCPAQSDEMCKASKLCIYDATTDNCSPAPLGVKGECTAIQDDAVCRKDGSCAWDATTNKCKDKVASIHTWKKVVLSDTLDGSDIKHFVRSGDKQHLYAFNESAGDTGLYYSADAGASWTEIEAADINGTPKDGATNVILVANQASEVIMRSTESGLVIANDKRLFILQGNVARWGIDTSTHNATAGGGDQVDNVADADISFFNVVKLQHRGERVESVVFGQNEDLVVFAHDTGSSFESAPFSISAKQTDGTALAENPKWKVANNAQNGNLLLASDIGVWEFALANTDRFIFDPNHGYVNNNNFGEAISDNQVIKPENGGMVDWSTGVGGGIINLTIMTVGSLLNDANQLYYVGLQTTNTNQKDGGLAYTNGPQGIGHASLVAENKTVSDLIKYESTYFLVTNKGFLAINSDGTLNPADDFSFALFKNDKDQMMEGGSAVDLRGNEKKLKAIVGDTDDSWFFIEDVGLYHRVKSQGQPRP